MKLEKFKKYGARNKKIIGSVIGIIILVCGVLLLKSFAFFESKYDFDVIKGRIPPFNVSDVTLAFTIDGVKSNDVFPSIDSGYIPIGVTCQNGVTAEWSKDLWGLVKVNPNGNKKISCNIDFGVPLYKVVNVGDLISYTPSSTSYIISKSLTGYSSDQTINPSELNLWRVIRKNDADKTVEMVSEYVSSTSVYITNRTGFDNYAKVLNLIAKQYETEEVTSGSRYITMSDLDLIRSTMRLETGLKSYKNGTDTYVDYWVNETFLDYNTGYSGKYWMFSKRVTSDGLVSIGEIAVHEYWGDERGYDQAFYVRPIVVFRGNLSYSILKEEADIFKIN